MPRNVGPNIVRISKGTNDLKRFYHLGGEILKEIDKIPRGLDLKKLVI